MKKGYVITACLYFFVIQFFIIWALWWDSYFYTLWGINFLVFVIFLFWVSVLKDNNKEKKEIYRIFMTGLKLWHPVPCLLLSITLNGFISQIFQVLLSYAAKGNKIKIFIKLREEDVFIVSFQTGQKTELPRLFRSHEVSSNIWRCW